MAKFTIKADEMKKAISSIQALNKSIPGSGVSAGDAKCALLRSKSGFSLVSSTDSTIVEIKLPTLNLITEPDSGDFDEWDGVAALEPRMLIGFAELDDLVKLLTKHKSDVVEIETSKANHMMTIKNGNSENQFDIVEPRMIPSRFTRFTDNENSHHAFTLSNDQMDWFASIVGNLGNVISPSVARPGFGAVVFNAYPSKSKPLMISGNSDSDGFSFIYSTVIASEIDFEMLIQKPLAISFNAFVKAIGKSDGDTEFDMVLSNRRTKTLILRNGSFMLSIACSAKAFPFAATESILKMAASPRVNSRIKYSNINDMLARTSVSAISGSVTSIEISDGGVMSMKQYGSAAMSNVLARDSVELESLPVFPNDVGSVSTIVRTDVLKKAITTMKNANDFNVMITNENDSRKNGKLVLEHDFDIAIETAVLMGIKGGR